MKKLLLLSISMLLLFISPVILHAQEKYLVITSADLLPHDNTLEYTQNGTFLSYDSGPGNGYFYAPLHLPDGVKIKKLVFFFEDKDTNTYISGNIYRVNLYTGSVNYLIMNLSVTGATPGRQVISAYTGSSYNIVNNQGYGYLFCVNFGMASTKTKFFGAKIFYQ